MLHEAPIAVCRGSGSLSVRVRSDCAERRTFFVELGVHAWPRSPGTVRRLQVWPRLHNTPVSAQSTRADLSDGWVRSSCILQHPELGLGVPGTLVSSPSLPRPQGGRSVSVLRPRHDPCVTCPLHTEWDNPTCTEGVVSVPRGERAVMGCNISNPFLSVAVGLGTPGASVQPLFRVRSPGCFCREGWQLRVQGGVAQLVIDNASDSQTGCYKWHLQGLQRNIGVTTLNVSGEDSIFVPPAHPRGFRIWEGRGSRSFPPKSSQGPGMGPRERRPGFRQSRMKQDQPPLLQGPAPRGGQAGAALSREEARPCVSPALPQTSSLPARGERFHPQPLQSFVCPRRARLPALTQMPREASTSP
ncbi:secreted and transmembrane protein 1 [Enhydra lutris kenyoni]|uniref:Secreted and transmembrane protein 1 n=1 Tax=Enhydra lutris kenyoni TaxID=391180 RepID=A0A2Y9KXX5_ENHLU|nr:secreted and transmembrane protein 1 [Enhydra lutris kenyoni]